MGGKAPEGEGHREKVSNRLNEHVSFHVSFHCPSRWLANGGNGSLQIDTLGVRGAFAVQSPQSLAFSRERSACVPVASCHHRASRVEVTSQLTVNIGPAPISPAPGRRPPYRPSSGLFWNTNTGTLERWEHTLNSFTLYEFTSLLIRKQCSLFSFLLLPPASSILLPPAPPHTLPFHVLFNLG